MMIKSTEKSTKKNVTVTVLIWPISHIFASELYKKHTENRGMAQTGFYQLHLYGVQYIANDGTMPSLHVKIKMLSTLNKPQSCFKSPNVAHKSVNLHDLNHGHV